MYISFKIIARWSKACILPSNCIRNLPNYIIMLYIYSYNKIDELFIFYFFRIDFNNNKNKLLYIFYSLSSKSNSEIRPKLSNDMFTLFFLIIV